MQGSAGISHESAGSYSPAVVTIVLNYNNISDTIETIDSICSLDYGNNALLLVENSTEKEVVKRVRSMFPFIEIIENKRNLGYAGGNNVGIRWALQQDPDYIFILNNDVTLPKGVLDVLVGAMESHPNCAAAQPIVSYYHEMDKVWSAGTELALGYPGLYLKGADLHPGPSREPPFGLVGCALLIRAEALRQIGLFDESLFLMHEETDWCIRAKKLGFSLLVVPDAVAYHKVSETLGHLSKTYLYYAGRNWLLVGKRHFRLSMYVYILITELLTRIPYYLFNLAKIGQIDRIRFYLYGLADGLRGVSDEKTL